MSQSTEKPSRGEIWLIDLDPILGHEQGGRRPALVISDDLLNHGPADLAIVLPVTTAEKRIPSHVRVDPSVGGLMKVSFIKCEDIRSVSVSRRFGRRLGKVDDRTIEVVEQKLRYLLAL